MKELLSAEIKGVMGKEVKSLRVFASFIMQGCICRYFLDTGIPVKEGITVSMVKDTLSAAITEAAIYTPELLSIHWVKDSVTNEQALELLKDETYSNYTMYLEDDYSRVLWFDKELHEELLQTFEAFVNRSNDLVNAFIANGPIKAK